MFIAWFILVTLVGLGLLIAVEVWRGRHLKPHQATCWRCGHAGLTANFCPHCGIQLESDVAVGSWSAKQRKQARSPSQTPAPH